MESLPGAKARSPRDSSVKISDKKLAISIPSGAFNRNITRTPSTVSYSSMSYGGGGGSGGGGFSGGGGSSSRDSIAGSIGAGLKTSLKKVNLVSIPGEITNNESIGTQKTPLFAAQAADAAKSKLKKAYTLFLEASSIYTMNKLVVAQAELESLKSEAKPNTKKIQSLEKNILEIRKEIKESKRKLSTEEEKILARRLPYQEAEAYKNTSKSFYENIRTSYKHIIDAQKEIQTAAAKLRTPYINQYPTIKESLIQVIRLNLKRIISHQKLIATLDAANAGTPENGPKILEKRLEDLQEISQVIKVSLLEQKAELKHLEAQARIDKEATIQLKSAAKSAREEIELTNQDRIKTEKEIKALERLESKIAKNKEKIQLAKKNAEELVSKQNAVLKIEAEAKDFNIASLAKQSSGIEHELFFRNYLESNRLGLLKEEIKNTVKKPGLEVNDISLAEILHYFSKYSWNLDFVNKASKKLMSLVPELNANQSKALKEIMKKWSMDNPNSIVSREFTPLIINNSNRSEFLNWAKKKVKIDNTIRANHQTRFGKAILEWLKANPEPLRINPQARAKAA